MSRTGTRTRAATAEPPPPVEPGIELVPARPLVQRVLDAWLPLRPGDVPRVASGETVGPGTVLVDRLRDGHLVEASSDGAGRAGERWTGDPIAGHTRHTAGDGEGERLFESNGRWRIASGDRRDPLESPIAGIVREVRPGIGMTIRAAGHGLRGILTLGDPTRGRLEIATDADGELLPRSLDVGSSGAILVVGARIDAEALTRARAMGIRGIVVATLPGKDRRDFLASESRQRAALHRLSPFGVLILHGSSRRAIAAAVMRRLEALAGREVAIIARPAALVYEPDEAVDAADALDEIHVRSGPLAGRAGRWAGPAGVRRFPGGTHLEAGFVRFGDDPPIALPLADLERHR